MSWKRPASGGGGFLSGADFAITSLKFETKEWESDKPGGKKYSTITAAIEVLVDGAEEPNEQYLRAGFFYPEDQKLSKDGTTIVCEKDGPLTDDSEFIRFVDAAVAAGFPEDLLEEGKGKNFQCLVGHRFRGIRVKDVERQMAAGKKKLGKKAATATTEEIMVAGKRDGKNKDGEKAKFDHDYLSVDKYYGEAEVKASGKSKSKSSAKAEPKAEAKTAAKDKGGDTKKLDKTLLALFEDVKPNKDDQKVLKRGGISGAVVRYALANDIDDSERDVLREALFDEDYIKGAESRGLISYDGDDKNQPLTLA